MHLNLFVYGVTGKMAPKKYLLLTGILLVWLSFGVRAQESTDFEEWLVALRQEALAKGIRPATLDAALKDVSSPLQRVLELDRSQPEFMQTFSGYMNARISDARIRRGRAMLEEHAPLLRDIERRYGVQPHYLVAFWALESNFGDFTGGFSVINALATLAFDPRRSQFFRNELFSALQIIDDGHIEADRMTGSWAGAMGQCQFMPSTFANYAVDGDGDGKIDIWNSLPDIFASAANYLSKSGWRSDERWGREVRLPQGFDLELSGTSVRKPVREWSNLGVTRVDGSPLGNADIEGSIILPAGAAGPAFIGYRNFRTIMVWNRSTLYALSVGHLADRFMGEGPIRFMPGEERALSRGDVLEMQKLLSELGFDTGTPDGVVGTMTRDAVRNFQVEHGLPSDGHPSHELLTTLRVMTLSE
jgi:membrane-bound lytic murein transglycosylase B